MFEHRSERTRSERQADDDPRHPRNPAGARGQAGIPAGRHPAAAAVEPTGRGADALPRHRGADVAGSHRRRPITPATTVVLALVAAAITVWLGLVAQFGGVTGVEAPVPDRLAVVQVQTGETLQQVAHRVAPDAPVGQVVERIRELNQLDSVALDAGQTLIAPIALTVRCER